MSDFLETKAQRKAYRRAYYLAHRDEELAKKKARNDALSIEDKQIKSVKRHARYLANRDEELTGQVRRREADPEGFKARVRRWYVKNQDVQEAKQQAYYVEHRAEILAKKKAYRLEHHDQEVLQDKIYYDANQPLLVVKAKERRVLHPEVRQAWYADHQETILAKARARYETHTEEEAARGRAWRQKNPDQVRARVKRRRATKANAPLNDFSHAQWLEIQEAQKHCCYYCGKRCKGHLTQDHILALTQGGSHTASNIVAACQSCNSRKNTKPPPVPVQMHLLTIAPKYEPRTRRPA